MCWWREWSTRHALLQLKVSGLEYCIVNNESRYNELKAMLSPSRPDDAESMQLPLDAAPPPPGLFWLTRNIGLEISAASVMIGNSALKTMLVVAFSRANGSLSLVDREDSCYRMQADLRMYEVTAKVKSNRQYEQEGGESERRTGLDRLTAMMRRQRRRLHEKIHRRMQKGIPMPKLHLFSKHGHAAEDEAAENKHEAAEDDLLLSPLVHLHYYIDLAGFIDEANAQRSHPPMTGIVVTVAHGVLTYGPWEDRQRAAIQRWLLPQDYAEGKTHTPRTGYLTEQVGFHTKIKFMGSVVVRLPFSKDVSRRLDDYDSSSARNGDAACGPALVTIKAGEEPLLDGVAASKRGLGGWGQDFNDAYRDETESDTQDSETEEKGASVDSQDGSSVDGSRRSRGVSSEMQSWTDSWSSASSSSEWRSEDSEWESWGKGRKCPWDLEEMELIGTVDVITPWLLEEERYEMVTEVNLTSQVTIASSIQSESNEGVLWECDKIHVMVSMGGGLKFNDLATTDWDISVGDSTVRLLRDHTFLITSLITDWGWEPPVQLSLQQQRLYFIPSQTVFKLTLVENYSLGLIVNEDNVVNDFAADAENNVLWLHGNRLEIVFDTPRPQFRPATMVTKFQILVSEPDFALYPRTSANDFHAPLKNCIKADDLEVCGEITSCQHDTTLGYRHADSSVTTVTSKNFQIAAHGVVYRAFMNFLDNYFGASMHIITSTEYQTSQNQNRKKKAEIKERHYHQQQSQDPQPNDFHVHVRVVLSDVTVILPNHLVVTSRRPPTARAYAHEVLVDMSSTSSQSDLVVTVTPISIKFPAADKTASKANNGHVGSLYIDGVDYHDHSYNGVAPMHECYRNFNRILVGEIRGSPTAMDIRMLSNFIAQLGEQGPRLIQQLDGEVPRKWWLRPRAWNSQQIEVKKVAVTAAGPACLIEISLPRGLTVSSGGTPINSRSHTTTRIRLKRLLASLNVVSVEGTAQRFKKWGGGAGDGENKNEFGFEVGRLETSATLVLKIKYSDWGKDQAKQLRFLTKNDGESGRLRGINNSHDWNSDSDSDSADEFGFFDSTEGSEESSDELTFVTASSQGYEFSDDASFVTASDGDDSAFVEPPPGQLGSFRSVKQGSFRSRTAEQAPKSGDEHRRRGSQVDESLAYIPFAFIARRGLVRTVVPMETGVIEYPSLEGREPVQLCMISNPGMLRQRRQPSWSATATPTSAGVGGGLSPTASQASAPDITSGPRRSVSVHSIAPPASAPDNEATHAVEIGVHGIVVQMSPLSLDALSAMVESVPPLSRTAEGCVDLLSGLHPKESMSYAFAGPHKVVNVLRVKATFAELQLLQRLPPDTAFSRFAAHRPKKTTTTTGAEHEDSSEMSILNVAAKGVLVEKMDSKTVQGPKLLPRQRRGSELRLSMLLLRDGKTRTRQSHASMFSADFSAHGASHLDATLRGVTPRGLEQTLASPEPAERARQGAGPQSDGRPRPSRDSTARGAGDARGREAGEGVGSPPLGGSSRRGRAERRGTWGEAEGEEDRGKSGEFNVELEGFVLWVCRLPDWRPGGGEGGDGGFRIGLGREAMAAMLEDAPLGSTPPQNMDVIAIAHGHGLVAKFRADDYAVAAEAGQKQAGAGVTEGTTQAAKLLGSTSSHMLLRLKFDPVSVLVCTAAAALLGPSAFLWMEVYTKLQAHVERRRKVVQRNVRMIYDLVANREGVDMQGLSSHAIIRMLAQLSIPTYRPRRASLAPTEKLQANQELWAARHALLGSEDSFAADCDSPATRRRKRISRKLSTRSLSRKGSTNQPVSPAHVSPAPSVSPSGSPPASRRLLKPKAAFKWTDESIRALAIAVAGSREPALAWLDNCLQLPFDALEADKEQRPNAGSLDGGWRMDVVATVGQMMVHFVPTESGEEAEHEEVEADATGLEKRFGSQASSVCVSPSHVKLVATNLRRSCPVTGEPISELGGVIQCERWRVVLRPPFVGLVSEAGKGFSKLAMQQAKDVIQRRREMVGTVDVFADSAAGGPQALVPQAAKKVARQMRMSRSNSIMELSREEVGWFQRQRKLSEQIAAPPRPPLSAGSGKSANGPGKAAPAAPEEDAETMMHIQVEVAIDVDALVPAGKLTLSVGSSVTSYTQTPRTLARHEEVEPGSQSTMCVAVRQVMVKAVPDGQEDDCPQVAVKELQASYMSTADCPPLQAKPSGQVVKDTVHQSRHTFTSMLLNIDGVEASLDLPKVSARDLRTLLSPWLHAVKASQQQAIAGAGDDHDAAPPEPEYYPGNQIQTVIMTVRGVSANVRVLPSMLVHYENSWGLDVDMSHYTLAPELTTPDHSPVALHRGRSEERAVRNSSELSFQLHQGRLWSEKDGEKLAGKNELSLPELRGHGRVQAKCSPKPPPSAGAAGAAGEAVERPVENAFAIERSDSIKEEDSAELVNEALDEMAKELEEELEHVTNFEMVLYMKEMVNEANEAMLNSLLEIQRTMTNEINMMLQNAERHLASAKAKEGGKAKAQDERKSGGTKTHARAKEFCVSFLLQGFRFRILAPTTALLLDTGFVDVKVSGTPKVERKDEIDLIWSLTLRGLSVVATSPSPSPKDIPPALASVTASQTTWILAQMRTDVRLENSNFDFVVTPIPSDVVVEAQNKFRLLLANNKVIAHPGFLQWIAVTVKHFSEAFTNYQQQRDTMKPKLQEMDRLSSTVRQQIFKKGTSAVQGSIPELPHVEILIERTSVSLLFTETVPERFEKDLPSKAEDMFKVIKLWNTEVVDSVHDVALMFSVGRVGLDVHPSVQTSALNVNVLSMPPYKQGSSRGGLKISNVNVWFTPNTAGSENLGVSIPSIEGHWRGRVRGGGSFREVRGFMRLQIPGLDVALEAATVASVLSFVTRWGGDAPPSADSKAQTTTQPMEPHRLSFTDEDQVPEAVASDVTLDQEPDSEQEQAQPQVTSFHVDIVFELGGGRIKVFGSDSAQESTDLNSTQQSARSPGRGSDKPSFRLGKASGSRAAIVLELGLPWVSAAGNLNLLHYGGKGPGSEVLWMADEDQVLSKVQLEGNVYRVDRNIVSVSVAPPPLGGIHRSAGLFEREGAKSEAGAADDADRDAGQGKIEIELSPVVLYFIRDVAELLKQHSAATSTNPVSNTPDQTPTASAQSEATPRSRLLRRVSSLITPSSATPQPRDEAKTPSVFKNETTVMLSVAPVHVKLSGSAASGPSRYAYLDSHLYHQAELHVCFGTSDGNAPEVALTATAVLSSFQLSGTKSVGPYELRNVVAELSSVRLSLWPSIKDQADHLTLERIMSSCYFRRRGFNNREALLYVEHVAAKVDVLTVLNGANLAREWSAAMSHVSEGAPDKPAPEPARQSPKGHKYCAKVGSWDLKVLTPLGTATCSTSSAEDLASLVLLGSLGELRPELQRQKRFARTATVGSFRQPGDRGKRVHQDSFIAVLRDCALDLERLKNKQYGCVEGGGGVPRAFVQASALRSKVKQLPVAKANSYNVKGLRGEVQGLHLELLYDQSRVLALHADRLLLDAQAEFLRVPDKEGVLPGLDVSVSYHRLVVQVCSATLPTFKRIAARLSTSEVAGALEMTRQPSLERTPSRLDASLNSSKGAEAGKLEAGAEAGSRELLAMQVEFRVAGEELHASVFADDFDDVCVHLSLRELQRLRLNRMLDDGDLYHSLQLQLADCILFKVERGLLPAIHRLSVDAVRAAPGKYIFRFPDMGLDLDTVQRLENRLGPGPWHVTWDLLSDFRNPIDISPDLTLYDFLKRLIMEDYASSFHSAAPEAAISPSHAAPTAQAKTEVDYKLNVFELHPKFGPLGDLTPDVTRVLGWLGTAEKGKKDQDRICHALRTGVVENVELVCRKLAAVIDKMPPRRAPGIAWSEQIAQRPPQ